MKKKLLKEVLLCITFMLFATLVTFSANAATIASGTCGPDATWTYDDAGVITITGTGEITSAVSLPYDYDNPFPLEVKSIVIGYGITDISAPVSYYNVQSISLPESLVSIKAEAFNFNNLNSVHIPASVSYIDRTAFDRNIKSFTVDANNAHYMTDGLGGLFTKDKTTMIGYYGDTNITTYLIPYGVVTLGEYALEGLNNLSAVGIPITLAHIGDSAFLFCDKLSRLDFSAGNLTTIGENAFRYSGLREFIPSTVLEVIKNGAFSDCDIESINLPTTVKEFSGMVVDSSTHPKITVDAVNPLYYMDEYGAILTRDNKTLVHFNDTSATSYAIPYGVTTIEPSAFESCGISEIGIPDTLTHIGDFAFSCCQNLKKLDFSACNLTTIGEYAFTGCHSLTSIKLPSTLSSLGASAFFDCESLKAVRLSKTAITCLNGSTFNGCKSLSDVTFPKTLTGTFSGEFCGCESLTEVTIPNGVREIADGTFRNCPNLRKVTIPPSVIKISGYFEPYSATAGGYEGAFDGDLSDVIYIHGYSDTHAHDYVTTMKTPQTSYLKFVSLGSYDIPDVGTPVFSGVEPDGFTWTIDDLSVLTLSGSGVFDLGTLSGGPDPEWLSCPWDEYSGIIKKVVITEGVTGLDDYTFCDSPNLSEVVLPKSFTYCGEGEFLYPDSRYSKKVTICGTSGSFAEEFAKTSSWYEFSPLDESGSVITEFGSFNDTVSWTFNEDGTFIVKGTGEMPATIADVLNNHYTRVKSIVVENGITSICKNAFANCHSVKNISLPESLTVVGDHAFSKCLVLKSVKLPASLTEISSYMFNQCTVLESVEIPYGITAVKDYAFGSCQALSHITLPDSVQYIGKEVFSGCTSLKSLKIPYGVPAVHNNLFKGCTSLENVEVPDTVKSIGRAAFMNCTSLGGITLPDTITNIELEAFKGCSALAYINLPEQLKYVDSEILSGCSSLKTVVVPENVPDILSRAFDGCSSLKRLILPKKLKSFAEPGVNQKTSSAIRIYGYSNTFANQYANSHSIRFIAIDEYKSAAEYANAHPEIRLTIDKAELVKNGKKTTLEVPAQILSSRTMVPLRAIFEALGASVEWEGATSTVTSVLGETTVILTVGNSFITVNGEEKPLDVPAQIVNSRTLVPARAVAEAFGCDVVWVPETRTVVISR